MQLVLSLTHSVQLSPHSLGPSSDWQKCKLLPQNFSLRGDHLQRIEGMHIPPPNFMCFFSLSLLMPRLNGNSLSCVLRGRAEHAVVTKDNKEWGHNALPSSLPFLPWQARGKGSQSTCVFGGWGRGGHEKGTIEGHLTLKICNSVGAF